MVSMKRKHGHKKRAVHKRSSKKPTATAVAHSLNKLQKKEVKKLIKGPEETKYISTFLCTPDYRGGLAGYVLSSLTPTATGVVGTNFHPYINSTSQIFAAIPQMGQGVDSYNRIGDKVSPTKCKVDMTFCLIGVGDSHSYDINVHVWVLRATAVGTLDNFSSIPITQLLDNGRGGDQQFDGSQLTEQLPLNRKLFHQIHHRTFRMCKVDGVIGPQGSPRGGATQSGPGPQTSMVRLSLNIPVKQKFVYDTASTLYPNNCAPFIVVGYSTNDQSTGGTSSPSSLYDNGGTVMCIARTHLWYKDA